VQVPSYWEWGSTNATTSGSGSSSSSSGASGSVDHRNLGDSSSKATEAGSSTMELRAQLQSLDDTSAGSPLLLAVENFLSLAECEHLIDLAKTRLQRSHVVGQAGGSDNSGGSSSSSSSSINNSGASTISHTSRNGNSGPSQEPATAAAAAAAAAPADGEIAVGARSSSSCWLSASKSPVLERIRARAAALLGLEVATFAPHTEDLQVLVELL